MIKIDQKIKFSGLLDTRNAVHTDLNNGYDIIKTKYPNNDLLYGPYNNINEAFSALSEKNSEGIDSLVVGKTVGIIINNKIVEYWFEEKCENISDLVPKNNNNSDNTQVTEIEQSVQSIRQDVTNLNNRLEVTESNLNTVKTDFQSRLDGKVDNTITVNGHILNKNVTLTYEDINAIPASDKGANDGVATLGSDGKVPEHQLPSYVDDVLEYENLISFPPIGESGKIYVANDTNLTYRWAGSRYVEVSPSIAIGETSSTAFAGDKGKVAYNHAISKGSAFESNIYKFATNKEGHVIEAVPITKDDILNLGINEGGTKEDGVIVYNIEVTNGNITTSQEKIDKIINTLNDKSTSVIIKVEKDNLVLTFGTTEIAEDTFIFKANTSDGEYVLTLSKTSTDNKFVFNGKPSRYPASNQIVYETIDGSTLNLDNNNIVSDIYYRDLGFGIITYKNTIIDMFSLEGKEKITHIVLPDSVTTLPNYFVSNCPLLEEIYLPNNITYVRGYGFQNCINLKRINLPENITRLEDGTFNNCDIREITLPNGIEYIGRNVFKGNKNLKEIVFPDSVVNMGNINQGYICRDCTSLEKFTLSQSFPKIIKGNFYNCTSLKYITFPSWITDIEVDSFLYVNPIEIDSSLSWIKNFPGVSKLEKLILRYNGVVKDVETYISTFKVEEGKPIPEGATLLDEEGNVIHAEDGIMPLTNVDAYIGTPNNWLKIYVPTNQLNAYRETYPTLVNYLHPITGDYDKDSSKEDSVVITPVSGETLNANVGRYYRFDDAVNTLKVTLPKVEETDRLKSLVLSFTTGDNPAVTITSDSEIAYFSGYSIEPNTTYEINLMFNGTKCIVAYGIVEQ